MVTPRLARTEKGQAEIVQQHRNLRGKLRTVLFLVDPGKSLDEIRQQAARIGAPDDALAQLLAEGYITELGAAAPAAGGDDAERFRVAQAFMNAAIVDALGIRAFLFTRRLERCASCADLTALLPDYAAALGRKLDPADVDSLVARTRGLLAVA